MFDPSTLSRLAQIRQQEILEQAALDRQPRVTIIQWSRLLEPIHAFMQRRARHSALQLSRTPLQAVSGQAILDECPCE